MLRRFPLDAALRWLLALPLVLCATTVAQAQPGGLKALVLDRASEQSEDPAGRIMALDHGLEAMGIPHEVRAFSDAAAGIDPAVHPLVLINSHLEQGEVLPPVRDALEQYVRDGGTLFAIQVQDTTLLPLFGADTETRTRDAFWIDFEPAADPVLFSRHDHPNERTIRLADPGFVAENFDWVGYYEINENATVLATLRGADGSDKGPCMLRRDLGAGRAYLFGATYFTTLLRGEAGRDAEAQRIFVNELEPGGDAVRLLLLGALDRATGGHSARLYTQPGTQDTSLIVSHDWDSFDAFHPGAWGEPIALRFARMHRTLGIEATNFLTTKWFTDGESPAYWDAGLVCDAAGETPLPLGSHSVGHRTDFASLPVGSRETTCADYDPQAATVNDELRCSKERIETDVAACLTADLPPVDSFRSGKLLWPPALPQELEAAGYRYDASRSGPDSLTYYPYRLTVDSAFSEETEIIEVPLALDDVDLAPGDPGQVVQQWRQTARDLAANGAPVVLLVHPSRGRNDYGDPESGTLARSRRLQAASTALEHQARQQAGEINPDAEFKIEAQQSFIRFAQGRQWPVMDLRSYGEFWRAREAVTLVDATFDPTDGSYVVLLRNDGAAPAADITLEFGDPVVVRGVDSPAPPTATAACRRVHLDLLPAGTPVTLTLAVDAADDDGDGTVDGCDVCPEISDTQQDFDGDGVGDRCELRGDVDGTGRVNGVDLARLAGAFGIDRTHPRYDPACDLDRNGAIDGSDLAILAAEFGAVR